MIKKVKFCFLILFLLNLFPYFSYGNRVSKYYLVSFNQKESEPILPEGLSSDENSEEPSLPQGLEDNSISLTSKEEEEKNLLPFELKGFWESRLGSRIHKDKEEERLSIGETRVQLEITKEWEKFSIKSITDFVFDPVYKHYDIQLEKGEGFIDLRELNVSFSPFSFLDMKIGRQILTWGTGDMIFLNDLFPKDWNSFFIGRDEEYLKAPSDALKSSLFLKFINVDFIYAPRFDPDRFVDGRRISYWSSSLNKRVGRDHPVRVILPNDWFDDDEIFMRFFKNISGKEFALYFYHGFWKSPAGIDPSTSFYVFPRLEVYGFSIRGNILGGVGWLESSYYNSLDDRTGDNPFIKNSEVRFLVGFEKEIAKDFTGTFQYYLEHMMDYKSYKKTLPKNSYTADKDRHLITIRLTKLLMQQNLKLSFFGYFCVSDGDLYLRPSMSYKITDSWTFYIGTNIFWGKDPYTFFGQFERNSNVYIGLRYSFLVE